MELEDELRPVSAEISLWRSVLDQVFADAFSFPVNEDEERIRSEALDWFKSTSAEDFADVCFLANVSERTVRKIFDHFQEKRK